ncbi:MAG: hypothetical protein AAFY20_15160 [Cyanobacteria bacterium J06639_14]
MALEILLKVLVMGTNNLNYVLPWNKDDAFHVLDSSRDLLNRIQSKSFPVVPLLMDAHKDVPRRSGIYFGLTYELVVMYVGKSVCLKNRCYLRNHIQLQTCLSEGAYLLGWIETLSRHAWAIEQILIAKMKPAVNKGRYQPWWEHYRKLYPGVKEEVVSFLREDTCDD